jgi:hypothetical protein
MEKCHIKSKINITYYNLRVILHGCGTSSLTLSAELKVFVNRVLRKIFGAGI